ncbi:MAG: hypothetical protein J2P15_08725 [Micromonosporaceae bacterium]|nr:hypothetical protein [Micromonosporaceae bacterium]
MHVGTTVRVPSEAVDAYLSPGLQPVEGRAQLALLVNGVVDEMVARSTADLDTRLEHLRQELRELKYEVFPTQVPRRGTVGASRPLST